MVAMLFNALYVTSARLSLAHQHLTGCVTYAVVHIAKEASTKAIARPEGSAFACLALLVSTAWTEKGQLPAQTARQINMSPLSATLPLTEFAKTAHYHARQDNMSLFNALIQQTECVLVVRPIRTAPTGDQHFNVQTHALKEHIE